MKINLEYLPIKSLTPYANNTRKHSQKDIEKIAASIERYEFSDPVGVWGENNTIVEGHGRVLAAEKLGMKEVPCIHLDHLTDEQRREYAIAHNRTAEFSEWDFELLQSELDGLDFGDFDLEFENGVDLTDEYGDEFELPDGEKSPICQMTFTLHQDLHKCTEKFNRVCAKHRKR